MTSDSFQSVGKKRRICILPDGTSLDLVIHDHEIYVFIDDDKGGQSDDSVGFFARSFDNVDCDHFARLLRTLITNRADEWHASKRGADSLHKSSCFRNIIKSLDRCQTRVFASRRTIQQLDSPDLIGQVPQAVLDVFELSKEIWPINKNRYSRFLLVPQSEKFSRANAIKTSQHKV